MLVEPVPHLFEAIARSYEGFRPGRLRVRPLWAAACPPDSGTSRTFYAFRANATSYNYTSLRTGLRVPFASHVQQLGSFRLKHMAHNAHSSEADLLPAVQSLEVPCTNLETIMCELHWDAGSVDCEWEGAAAPRGAAAPPPSARVRFTNRVFLPHARPVHFAQISTSTPRASTLRL